MKRILHTLALCAVLLGGATSCVGDLDQYPHTDTTSKDVYTSADNYEAVLSGIYAAMIQRISSVSSETRSQNYLRVLWMFQDCSTDALDDVWLAGESLTDINNLSWSAGDPWVSAMYYHIYNIVAMSNELIRNASDDRIAGYSEADRQRIVNCRNEARFLRAWAYSHALDFYSRMSFITENDPVGSYEPTIYDRRQMFDYLTGELRSFAYELPATNYGHANRGAAWALLARLYLNGEVYTGQPYWTECIAACREVMKEGYTLESDYMKLFNADNHLRTNEIIFALACDGTHTTTWDATTFITCGSVLQNFADYEKVYGTQDSGAWDCLRARPDLVDRFETGDRRALFISYDRQPYADRETYAAEGYYEKAGDTEYVYRDRAKDIASHDNVETGWRVNKWTNLTDDGQSASSCSDGGGANTDFPVFRLADVYLMLAEAVVRGGEGATRSEALSLVNQVRTRAYGGAQTGNITDADLTLDFLCDERLREFYMECQRRTDLIRFGRYTSGYQWQWKGGVQEGRDVDPKYAYLPVPEAELSANPGLQAANAELGY